MAASEGAQSRDNNAVTILEFRLPAPALVSAGVEPHPRTPPPLWVAGFRIVPANELTPVNIEVLCRRRPAARTDKRVGACVWSPQPPPWFWPHCSVRPLNDAPEMARIAVGRPAAPSVAIAPQSSAQNSPAKPALTAPFRRDIRVVAVSVLLGTMVGGAAEAAADVAAAVDAGAACHGGCCIC